MKHIFVTGRNRDRNIDLAGALCTSCRRDRVGDFLVDASRHVDRDIRFGCGRRIERIVRVDRDFRDVARHGVNGCRDDRNRVCRARRREHVTHARVHEDDVVIVGEDGMTIDDGDDRSGLARDRMRHDVAEHRVGCRLLRRYRG